MSETKPGYEPYNPDGLSKEELEADDAKNAAVQEKRLEKLLPKKVDGGNKTKGGNERSGQFGGLDKKFRKGLVVSHSKPGLLSPDRPDKDEIENGAENGSKGLNKKIKKLLNQFKFDGQFRLSTSDEIRGSYVFKLFVKSEKSNKIEVVLEFEDKPENILPRLTKHFQSR